MDTGPSVRNASAAAPGTDRGPVGRARPRLPLHCTRPLRRTPEVPRIQRRMREAGLHSVCEEARCPNRSVCWPKGHVTFMLLGDVCTRACRFCAVATGLPARAPDPEEPAQVARLAAELGLRHVVLTSVNRDDLPDGGAGHFAATVRALHAGDEGVRVEVLTPDFQGDRGAVATVCDAGPEVYNHNVETVPRLYRRVRPGASLARSLGVLGEARRLRADAVVKSGFMVGLGETRAEVSELLGLLREVGVDHVTVGQYLQPTREQLPVERYWEPVEFDEVADEARALGFPRVSSGPLVRSSLDAEETHQTLRPVDLEGRPA